MKTNAGGKLIFVVCLGIIDLALLPVTIYCTIWGVIYRRTMFPKKNITTKLAYKLGRFRGTINIGLIKVLKTLHIFNDEAFNEYYSINKELVSFIRELEGQ